MERLSDLTARLEMNERMRAWLHYVAAVARVGREQAPALMQEQGHIEKSVLVPFQRAAVSSMTGATDADLLQTGLSATWMESVKRDTILGRLSGTVPALFNIQIPVVTANPTAEWVGEAGAVPATSMTTDTVVLSYTKLSKLLAFSQELFRVVPGDRLVPFLDHHLRVAVQRAEDAKLLSTDAASAGVSPAGLLNGISATAGGATLLADIVNLFNAVRGGEAVSPTFICSPGGALVLASLDSPMTREVGALGGRLAGVPLITSIAAAGRLILVDAAALAVADGGVAVDSAKSASVALDDVPTGAETSAFQANLVFLKILRVVNWSLGHADGVGYVELGAGSPPA